MSGLLRELVLLHLASSRHFFAYALHLHVIDSRVALVVNEGDTVVDESLRAAALAKNSDARYHLFLVVYIVNFTVHSELNLELGIQKMPQVSDFDFSSFPRVGTLRS